MEMFVAERLLLAWDRVVVMLSFNTKTRPHTHNSLVGYESRVPQRTKPCDWVHCFVAKTEGNLNPKTWRVMLALQGLTSAEKTKKM